MATLDRAGIVDNNFQERVKSSSLPPAKSQTSPSDASLTKEDLIELFESQCFCRHIDLQARKLKEQNKGYYTIASAGHEGNAAIARVFRHTDMAFLHYRSGAFMLERARQHPETDEALSQLLSIVASEKDPVSSGRHKVFGNLESNVPPQTSTAASHLPKAVGAAFSISKAKELKLKMPLKEDSVILCSLGDASVNHSTAQGAINAAQWIAYSHYPLPIVFICEDNGLGISVSTPSSWIEETIRNRPALHYLQADGLNLNDVTRVAREAEQIARNKKQPVFLHIKTVRLLGHAGSDIESQYRSIDEIERDEANDPLLHTARILIENNFLSADDILEKYNSIRSQVEEKSDQAAKQPKLDSAKKIMASIIPPAIKQSQETVNPKEREKLFGDQPSLKRNMSQMINLALTDILLKYKNTLVFGEDVAKKGGVYHVTADLVKKFGAHRIFNSPLDEQTILGTAIGLAHNGFLPIPEIQFLAFFHNAEDQLRAEAATLPFFSNGQFTNPMVLRLPGLAYQKGFGGHFHNENSLAVLRDIPGIIIACPSNGLDAAKMLRTCVSLAQNQRRVVVFVEPIALYMTKDLHEPGDAEWLSHYPDPDETIPLGEMNVHGDSKEVTIITYGNGYYLSRQAQRILEKTHNISVKIIDLRWLAPLPIEAILEEVSACKGILIVDECRKTGSLSETLIAELVEKLHPLPVCHRLTGEDSFIPLGEAWQYVLPSQHDIVEAVLKINKELR